MSMNIYTAFRVKSRYLHQVLARFNAIMTPLVEDRIFNLMQSVKNTDKNEKLLPPGRILSENVWPVLKEASEWHEKNAIDPSASVSIWHLEPYCYIRPFACDYGYKFEKIFAPKKINVPTYGSYSYWDSSDKPEKISDEAWGRRRDVWSEIDDLYGRIVRLDVHFFEVDQTFFSRRFVVWGWPENGKSRFKHVPKKYRSFFEKQLEACLASRSEF